MSILVSSVLDLGDVKSRLNSLVVFDLGTTIKGVITGNYGGEPPTQLHSGRGSVAASEASERKFQVRPYLVSAN